MVEEVVLIKTALGGLGSGFVVNSSHDWLIVTNNHVVENNKYVVIVSHDKKEEYGKVMREDSDADLALVSFPNKHGRKGVAISNELPPVGAEIFAIGNPLAEEYAHSVSKGIISSANRDIGGQKYIQSDVTINPGNSGGPMVLANSLEVIGVAVFILQDESGSGVGINHFIQIPTLLKAFNISIEKE